MLSTYRLTEHHLSGSMSRWLPWLAELQPELFCEISPEHAAEIGVAQHRLGADHARPAASIRAKALVTRRIRPFRIDGKTVHHVGMPWHWGYKGVSDRRRGQRPVGPGRRPERDDPRGEGVRLPGDREVT